MREELNYWFDGQIRRALLQFTSIFQTFYYQNGKNEFKRVNAHVALNDRQTANILKNNSENVAMTFPVMVSYIKELQIVPERRQYPYHVDKHQFFERDFNEETQTYGNKIGQGYSFERYMPVPYDLICSVDIYTTNQLQKHQILEQILVLFNPSINLQTSDNVLDWCSLHLLELTDITWSNRSFPLGTDNETDSSTLTFKLNLWISPPAKLQQQKVIQQIITNMFDIHTAENIGIGEGTDIHYDQKDLLTRIITTPGSHTIEISGKTAKLLGPSHQEFNEIGEVYSWKKLLDNYGEIRQNISQLRLKTTNDIEEFDSDITATFEFTNEPNIIALNYNMFSFPINTLNDIDGVINPYKAWPTNGLPIAITGVRYLLTDKIGNDKHPDNTLNIDDHSFDDIGSSQAWGTLIADINDIIEWTGTRWEVMFDASNMINNHYVYNKKSTDQLKWDGYDWSKSIDGVYEKGYFRIFL